MGLAPGAVPPGAMFPHLTPAFYALSEAYYAGWNFAGNSSAPDSTLGTHVNITHVLKRAKDRLSQQNSPSTPSTAQWLAYALLEKLNGSCRGYRKVVDTLLRQALPRGPAEAGPRRVAQPATDIINAALDFEVYDWGQGAAERVGGLVELCCWVLAGGGLGEREWPSGKGAVVTSEFSLHNAVMVLLGRWLLGGV